MARTGRDSRDPLREILRGGGGSALDATLPSVAFLVAWLAADTAGVAQPVAVGAVVAVVAALGVALWGVRRGGKLRAVLVGLTVAVLAAALALWTGRAEDFFLPRIVANAGSLVAWVVSIAVRWPLLGLVVGTALGRPTAWRRDPDLVRGYSRASWPWAATYALRLAVLVPLWAADLAVALGVAQLLLTWPLIAVCLVVSWPLVRSALPPGHPGPRHPVHEEAHSDTPRE